MPNMEGEARSAGKVSSLEECPVPEQTQSRLGFGRDSFRMPRHQDLLAPEAWCECCDLAGGHLIHKRPEICRFRGKPPLGAQHPADLFFGKRLSKPSYRCIVAEFQDAEDSVVRIRRWIEIRYVGVPKQCT